MVVTPKLSLPLMQESEPPNLPSNNQITAQIVEEVVAQRIQHGKATVTGTGTNMASTTVTFSPAFASVPRVLATHLSDGATNYYASVLSVSTTQAVLAINRSQSSTATFASPRDINWIAWELS